MSWKAQARKTLVGDKRYFDTMPETEDGQRFWMKPRKFSIEAQDAISQAQYRMRERIGGDALKILTDRREVLSRIQSASEEKGEELSNEEIFDLLEPEELQTVIQGVPPQERYEIAKLELMYGWADSNFDIDENATHEQFVEELLDFPDQAREAMEFIEEWNRPLLDKMSRTSGTASSGSTTDTSSQTEPESSPTDETPSSSSGGGNPG